MKVPGKGLAGRLLFGALLVLAGGAAAREETAPAAVEVAAPAPATYQRIFLIGASVTAGFCTDEFLGGKSTPEFRLVHYLNAALPGAHEPIVSRASKMLFLDPLDSLEKQVTAALEAKPSLVLGVDAAFWLCYGSKQTPEQRLERFEQGLKLLERIEAPLVVGDLPDASRAVGKILSPDEMPPLDILAKCNERLKAWAAGRPQVRLVPLAAMMSCAGTNREFSLAGRTWPEGRSRELLQKDLLHPAPIGLAALAVAVLEVANPDRPAGAVRGDLDAIRDEAVAAGREEAVTQEAKIQKLIEENRKRQAAPAQ